MKINYFLILLFSSIQLCNAQTGTIIKGNVTNGNFPMEGVDVINFNSKKNTITDNFGNFSILVKEKDSLFFIYKDYYDAKYTVTKADIGANKLSIVMFKRPIQIKAVEVNAVGFSKLKMNQQAIDKLKLEKQFSVPKVVGVYDGTIPNGVDFGRMFKGISNLYKKIFKKEGVVKEKVVKIAFKDYLSSNFNEDYYINTLKLKQEEIFVFIEFCDLDSKSKSLMDNINILSATEFLFAKKTEFDKIKKE